MELNEAYDVKQGVIQVERIYFGGELVWVYGQKYLMLSPDTVWLTEANDFTESVFVLSNTDWNINP